VAKVQQINVSNTTLTLLLHNTDPRYCWYH